MFYFVTWKFEISPRTHRWVTDVSPIKEEKRPEMKKKNELGFNQKFKRSFIITQIYISLILLVIWLPVSEMKDQ